MLVINNPKCMVNRLKTAGSIINKFLDQYEKENSELMLKAETLLKEEVVPCIIDHIKGSSDKYHDPEMEFAGTYDPRRFYSQVQFKYKDGSNILPDGFKFHYFKNIGFKPGSENEYIDMIDITEEHKDHIAMDGVSAKVYFKTKPELVYLRDLISNYKYIIDHLTSSEDKEHALLLNSVQEIGVPVNKHMISVINVMLAITNDDVILDMIKEYGK